MAISKVSLIFVVSMLLYLAKLSYDSHVQHNYILQRTLAMAATQKGLLQSITLQQRKIPAKANFELNTGTANVNASPWLLNSLAVNTQANNADRSPVWATFAILTALAAFIVNKVVQTRKQTSLLLRAQETTKVPYSSGIAMAATASSKDAPQAAVLKRRLLTILATTSMGKEESLSAAQEVDSLIKQLEPLQTSFDVSVADGEWLLNFTRNGDDAPKTQAAFSFTKGFQNFDVKNQTFRNIAQLFGKYVCVIADVKFRPDPEVASRLISEITYAGLHLGPLKIPLPLRATGWLEFLYLDPDLRITRGNRGGLFIHTRPPLDSKGRDSLDEKLSKRQLHLDPSGYFVIRVNYERQLIEAEHFPNTINEKGLACNPTTGEVLSSKATPPPIDRVFSGRTAKELSIAIFERAEPSLVSCFDHAAYLGREFQRAQECLETGRQYIQD